MKKIVLSYVLLIGTFQLSQAQLDVGIKAGVNYNSDSFKEVSDDLLSGSKSKTGIHLGVWLKTKIPVIGLYLRPEITYTELKNTVTYNNSLVYPTNTGYTLRKIDFPVLVEKNFFSIGSIFIGPSFQYVLSSDFELSDLSQVSVDNISLGIQSGIGIVLGRLGVDMRWERALTKIESIFVDKTLPNNNLNFDNRINQIIFGITYRLNKSTK